MTGERVRDVLIDIYHTVGKLKGPNIISVDLLYDGPRVHLFCADEQEFSDMLNGCIGLDLYHVDEDWSKDHARYSIEDTNGVEVYFLKRKTAPDASPSRAEEEEVIIEHTNSSCAIIGAGGQKVKEEA